MRFDFRFNSKQLKFAAYKAIAAFTILSLVFAWLFSGWPRIWNFPPQIEKVQAATQTYSSGSGSWTSPVTGTITVECWGAGGSGGGGQNSNGLGGGGGAGGQYASSSVSVNKGTNYAYSVGTGGSAVGRDSNGIAGGDTTFGSSTVVAKGGSGGLRYADGGTGGIGTTTGGVGTTVYAGGSGATQGAGYSGGGGGGAGSTGTGNSATTYTGGAAKTENGGAGGNGYVGNSGSGLPGSNYGGAGGGAERNGTSGAGAGGYVRITYPDNTAPTVALNTADGNDFGSDTTPTLEFTGTDANYLDDIRYNIQVCTTSNCSAVTLDKVSGTDAGFAGSPDNTDPFTSGQLVSYTVQSGEALSSGTYYWRARGIDPGGTNTYGSWSSIRSFTITAGSLTVDIVDSGGSPVASPSVVFPTKSFSWSGQTSAATLGVSSEKIRVSNATGTSTWTLEIAATSGNTAVWSGGTYSYDFNDTAANGRLQVDASAGTITPQSGCSSTGLSKGTATYFSQGATDSITILSAGATADTGCYWDFTGIGLTQDIPASQEADTYTIDMTLTVS